MLLCASLSLNYVSHINHTSPVSLFINTINDLISAKPSAVLCWRPGRVLFGYRRQHCEKGIFLFLSCLSPVILFSLTFCVWDQAICQSKDSFYQFFLQFFPVVSFSHMHFFCWP